MSRDSLLNSSIFLIYLHLTPHQFSMKESYKLTRTPPPHLNPIPAPFCLEFAVLAFLPSVYTVVYFKEGETGEHSVERLWVIGCLCYKNSSQTPEQQWNILTQICSGFLLYSTVTEFNIWSCILFPPCVLNETFRQNVICSEAST